MQRQEPEQEFGENFLAPLPPDKNRHETGPLPSWAIHAAYPNLEAMGGDKFALVEEGGERLLHSSMLLGEMARGYESLALSLSLSLTCTDTRVT